MQSIDFLFDLLTTCRSELGRLLSDFEEAPSSKSLFEIGAVAELLVLAEELPCSEPLLQMLCDGAAKWLRSGILEELSFSRVELGCHAALLLYLAQRGRGYSPADMATMRRLCEGRLFGRSEMPVLNQQLMAAYLSRCGVDRDFGEVGRRDLVQMIDKRVLRARSDEYDVQVLLMCAQLMKLGCYTTANRPDTYPRVLLVQAIRSGNANWIPILTFLCAQWFRLDDGLHTAALESILQQLPARGELLPAPASTGLDNEHITRARRGLRIRSTIAIALSLYTLGDSHAENRACVAVG